MTLTLAWIRKQGDTEELLIASDSRLRFGLAWDTCPKLFLTPRGDICFGFAGDTMYAYPLILQAINQMTLHRASMSREYDITSAKGHIQRLFEGMLSQRRDLPWNETIPEPPETLFIMAGFSWKFRRFIIWDVRYDQAQRAFTWTKRKGLRGIGRPNRVVIVGDPSMSERQRRQMEQDGKTPKVSREEDIQKLASERIARLAKVRAVSSPDSHLDMEPFEVLCEMLRGNLSPFVAGPPQLIKMYPSCSSQVVGVLWPDRKSNQVSVFGRPLLDYERLDCPLLDPDTLECSSRLWPTVRPREDSRANEIAESSIT